MSLGGPTGGRTLRSRVLQNSAALLGGRGIAIVVSAGATVLLARYLGSEQLGEYAALYAYVSLFGWLATFGLESILVREASRERGLAGSILLTGVVLCAALSIATTLLALAVAPFVGYRGPLHHLLLFAAIEILLLTPLRLPGLVFQVDLRQWYGTAINVFRQILWFGVVALLALAHAPLLYVFVGRLACAFVEATMISIASRRFLTTSWHFLPGRAKAFLRSSFPIAFSTLLGSIYMRIDQVMLHNLATDQILGQYVAAVKVSELFEMLPAALISSLFPILALAADRQPQFQSYVGRSFRYLIILASGLCVFIALGAKAIVALLYGRQFHSAAPLLAVLIWSEVAVFFGTVVVNVLIASNLQRYLLLPTAGGAIANILLNFVLIPRFGAGGAAWATLISYSLAWGVTLLPFVRTRALIWQGLRLAAPACALALVAVGAASILPAPDLIRVAAGMCLYGIGIWATRIISRDDFAYAWTALVGSLPR